MSVLLLDKGTTVAFVILVNLKFILLFILVATLSTLFIQSWMRLHRMRSGYVKSVDNLLRN